MNKNLTLEQKKVLLKEGTENAQIIWTYQFDRWNIFGPTESKDLVILFDEKNIVRAYRYTTSEPE